MQSILGTAQQLDTLAPAIGQHRLELNYDSVETSISSLVADAPTSLGKILPTRELEQNRDTVFTNVRMLNQLFYLLHPEYSRR